MTNTRAISVALLAIAMPTVAAGCGGGEDFANDPRPAVPIQLSGVITDKSVSVQPGQIGAGPIVLLISNQTQDAQSVTLDGEGVTPEEVGPINPEGTATIQKDLPQGEFDVEVVSQDDLAKDIRPGKITVAGDRPSASETLLLP
jgi:hypothetical protein